MSMSALWALSVSWMRTGSARALISWSLPLLSGYCTTETFVTEPSATVIWTCTGPQRVSAAVPVTVPDVAELLGPAALEDVELLDELEPVDESVPPAVGAVVVPAVPEPLAVVLPLYGVAADVLPPAAAAVDEVEVW